MALHTVLKNSTRLENTKIHSKHKSTNNAKIAINGEGVCAAIV